MNKSEAIKLLGGTHASAAAEIGISPQAVSGWPDELPARIVDRVQAALWRRHAAVGCSAMKAVMASSMSEGLPGSSSESASAEGQMSRQAA